MLPKAEKVSCRALLSTVRSRFLMKMLPTPAWCGGAGVRRGCGGGAGGEGGEGEWSEGAVSATWRRESEGPGSQGSCCSTPPHPSTHTRARPGGQAALRPSPPTDGAPTPGSGRTAAQGQQRCSSEGAGGARTALAEGGVPVAPHDAHRAPHQRLVVELRDRSSRREGK